MGRLPKRSKALTTTKGRSDRGTALQVWNKLEDTIGKERLVQMLEGSLDARFQKLLKELTCPLPALADKSIRELAKRNGIPYAELLETMRTTNLSVVLLKTSERVGEVMDDAVEDSLSRTITCRTCEGEGIVRKEAGDGFEEKRCLDCDGEGVRRIVGDADSRKLVFEAVGLTRKGQGVQLNQQFVNYQGSADESLEALIKDTDKVIDIEPVETADATDDNQT